MRTIAVLFSLMLIISAGCSESAVSVKDGKAADKPTEVKEVKLEYVTGETLEATFAANPLTLLDFTAKW